MLLVALANGNTYNNSKEEMKAILKGNLAAHTRLRGNMGRDIQQEAEAYKCPPESWREHPLIHTIYQHTRWWQWKTNQKDPLTQKLVSHIRVIGKTKHTDNFYKALADWLMVSLSVGYWGMKWIQDKDPVKHGHKVHSHPAVCQHWTWYIQNVTRIGILWTRIEKPLAPHSQWILVRLQQGATPFDFETTKEP